jgi:hypothetical protein
MDANGRQFFQVVFDKSFILLASQNVSSLNFFARHMSNVTGLRAEIVLINKDLLARPTNQGNRAGGSQMKKGPWLMKRA